MNAHNLMIVQGGGPTAVFNASLAAAINEAGRAPAFGRVFGAKSGTLGLVQGEVIDLTARSAAQLDLLRHTPGAALGSSRFKPSEKELHRAVETLRELDVHYMLFMGGNGTMLGADLFRALCAEEGYEIYIVGVPKTVDNDLPGTDRSPGYASAARYIAQSTQELGLDLRALPQPVSILETMGRKVGWLAAAAALAHTSAGDAPHLVYVPEIAFEERAFLDSLEQVLTTQGWAVVVVAEGIRNRDGSMVYELADAAQQDPLKRPLTGGVGQHLADVVATHLKVRCRSEKPGLLGRASMAHRSTQDLEDATLVGAAGVRALRLGQTGVMVGLTAFGSAEATTLIALTEVAGRERTLPVQWLTRSPLAVSEAFLTYLRPLIGELNHYAPSYPSTTVVQVTTYSGLE